jgi:hypothetical protein
VSIVSRSLSPNWTSYQRVVLEDSPISVWPLSETSGSTAIELVAARNATYRNTPTLGVSGPSSRRLKYGVTYNGTNQTTDTGDYAAYAKQASGTWTMEAWVKYTEVGSSIRTLMVWRGTTAVNEDEVASLVINNGLSGRISLNITSGFASRFNINSDGAWNDGLWHHVVGTAVSGGAASLYIDGILRGTDVTSRYANNTSARRVGLGSNITGPSTFGQYFPGSLCFAAIYGTTLTGPRVLAHFEAGVPPSNYQRLIASFSPSVYLPLNISDPTPDYSGNLRRLDWTSTAPAAGELFEGGGVTLNGTTDSRFNAGSYETWMGALRTIGCWVKTTSTADIALWSGRPSSNMFACYHDDTNGLRFLLGWSNGVQVDTYGTGAFKINDGQLHSVILAWSGTTTYALYVDGTVRASGNLLHTYSPSTSVSWGFGGGDGGGRKFIGQIGHGFATSSTLTLANARAIDAEGRAAT